MERRDRSKLREALLLLFVGTIVTMIGWRIKPPNDPPIAFSGQFVVQVPPAVIDAKGQPDPVETIEWKEAHGGESANAMVPGAGSPTSDTTRVSLKVSFDHDPQGVPVTVSFDIPAGAILDHCWPIIGTNGSGCKTQPSASKDTEARSKLVVSATVVLHSQDLGVVADLRNIAGLSFAANRKDVTVRYPMVVGDEESVTFFTPVQVTTEVHFHGVSDVRWTQNPSTGYHGVVQWEAGTSRAQTFHDDSAAWNYRFPLGFSVGGNNDYVSASPPPNITGTRVSVSNTDTDRVFYAGLAFGVAGGGYIGAIQALFVWLASGSGSGSGATLKRRRMRTTG